jgi:hypothetical protein
MTAQYVTILSGIVLLLVFALVGWRVGRRTGSGEKREPGQGDGP